MLKTYRSCKKHDVIQCHLLSYFYMAYVEWFYHLYFNVSLTVGYIVYMCEHISKNKTQQNRVHVLWDIVCMQNQGIILGMGSASERRRYNVTSSLIGCAHNRNDPCKWFHYKNAFRNQWCEPKINIINPQWVNHRYIWSHHPFQNGIKTS